LSLSVLSGALASGQRIATGLVMFEGNDSLFAF